jgi:peroxiredoxin
MPQNQPTNPMPRPSDRDSTAPAKKSTRDWLTRQSQWSNWTVLALIVLCFIVIIRFKPFASAGAQTQSEGPRLGELHLQPLSFEGQPVELSDLTGKVVLLSFWEPSQSDASTLVVRLADVERRFGRHPAFRLLAVSCDSDEQDRDVLADKTRRLLEQANVELPTYADPGSTSRRAVKAAAGLDRLPTTLVLDRRGAVSMAWRGLPAQMEQEIHQVVARCLGEQ